MKRRDFMRTAVTAGLASTTLSPQARGVIQNLPSLETHGVRKKPRIMFYHDGRHPAIYLYEPPMKKEEFEAAVDELVATPIDALMFGLGDGRTVFHNTKVGEVWGDPIKKWGHLIFRRAHQNVKMMIQAGRDPLRIVCERAHAKGMLIYPTLLVNQSTGKRGSDVRGSNFRWQNTQLEIGARGGLENFPGATNLDFKHEVVRNERFALIQEVLQNYPVDGFELQLNYPGRAVAFFHPQELEAGREIMTSWVKRVYEEVKASGEQRELTIRLPVSIENSYSLGLDVREWIRQGIVDVVVGESYSGRMDQLANFRPLVEAAKNSSCRIHAAVEPEIHSDRLDNGTIEFIRAVTCNYWAQGIDGLYLAMWFITDWPYQATFYEKLREIGHPDVMASKDKFYFVPTGSPTSGRETPLPKRLSVNQPVRVEFPITDDLTRWDKVDRVHEVLLRLRLTGTTELDRLKVRFNGKSLPAAGLRKINRMYRMRAPRYRVMGYWYVYRLSRDYWPIQGQNQVEVTLLRRDPDVMPSLELNDVEMEIKYLTGKNHARGQDPDEGPYATWPSLL